MAELKNLGDLWPALMALPPGRRLTLAVTAVVSLGFIGWVLNAGNQASFQTLYRGLPESDVAKLIDVLDGQNIEYQLDDGGTSVLVPAGQIHEARIRVAEKGLPAGGGVGFEIFDRPGFGVTEFVNRVNYQRALQGELARSIEQISAVARARVQLAVPEKSPFIGARERKPSASVVVRIEPGSQIESEQVAAIVHLVASSVEQLSPESVSVVDNRGRLLSSNSEGATGAGAPPGAQRYQSKLEQDLANRVESILEATVGHGRVIARVSADLDWTQTETTEEHFDPNSQIERSEQRSEETSSDGAGTASGVPGARAAPGGGGEAGNASKRTQETINYELNKKVTHSRSGIASIQRLTAAVLVDGKPVADGEEFQAWETAELEQFEALARQALGFKQDRGDEIVLTSAPFRSVEFETDDSGMSPDLLLLLTQLLRYGSLVLAVLIFGLMVVRPILHTIEDGASNVLPARVSELEARAAGSAGLSGETGAGPTSMKPHEIAMELGDDDAVRALRGWLRQK